MKAENGKMLTAIIDFEIVVLYITKPVINILMRNLRAHASFADRSNNLLVITMAGTFGVIAAGFGK